MVARRAAAPRPPQPEHSTQNKAPSTHLDKVGVAFGYIHPARSRYKTARSSVGVRAGPGRRAGLAASGGRGGPASKKICNAHSVLSASMTTLWPFSPATVGHSMEPLISYGSVSIPLVRFPGSAQHSGAHARCARSARHAAPPRQAGCGRARGCQRQKVTQQGGAEGHGAARGAGAGSAAAGRTLQVEAIERQRGVGGHREQVERIAPIQHPPHAGVVCSAAGGTAAAAAARPVVRARHAVSESDAARLVLPPGALHAAASGPRPGASPHRSE